MRNSFRCLIVIIPVTSFPQVLSGNPLILLDTRFRGYDGLYALTCNVEPRK